MGKKMQNINGNKVQKKSKNQIGTNAAGGCAALRGIGLVQSLNVKNPNLNYLVSYWFLNSNPKPWGND